MPKAPPHARPAQGRPSFQEPPRRGKGTPAGGTHLTSARDEGRRRRRRRAGAATGGPREGRPARRRKAGRPGRPSAWEPVELLRWAPQRPRPSAARGSLGPWFHAWKRRRGLRRNRRNRAQPHRRLAARPAARRPLCPPPAAPGAPEDAPGGGEARGGARRRRQLGPEAPPRSRPRGQGPRRRERPRRRRPPRTPAPAGGGEIVTSHSVSGEGRPLAGCQGRLQQGAGHALHPEVPSGRQCASLPGARQARKRQQGRSPPSELHQSEFLARGPHRERANKGRPGRQGQRQRRNQA